MRIGRRNANKNQSSRARSERWHFAAMRGTGSYYADKQTGLEVFVRYRDHLPRPDVTHGGGVGIRSQHASGKILLAFRCHQAAIDAIVDRLRDEFHPTVAKSNHEAGRMTT